MFSPTENSADSNDDCGDRLWMKVNEELQNQGFREGLDEGEELTLQEGFNLGYTASSAVCSALSSIRGSLSGCLVLAEAGLGEEDLTEADKTKINHLVSRTAELETEVPETLYRIVQHFSQGVAGVPGLSAAAMTRDCQRQLEDLCAKLELFATSLGIQAPATDSSQPQTETEMPDPADPEVDRYAGRGCSDASYGGSCENGSCDRGDCMDGSGLCSEETVGQTKPKCCRSTPNVPPSELELSPDEVRAALTLMTTRLTDQAKVLRLAMDKDPMELIKLV